MAKTSKLKSVSKRDPVEAACAPIGSKDKLLKAAFQIFSENGYHGTTTKQIAQAAQVNEALIMRHFRSKEGLFLAVIEKNVTSEVSQLEYSEQDSVEDELYKFCEFIIERDRKKNEFLRILIGHSLHTRKT